MRWAGGGARGVGGSSTHSATHDGQAVEAPFGVGHDDCGRDALPPVRLELRRRPVLIHGAVGRAFGQCMERARGVAGEAAKDVVDAQIDRVPLDVDGVVW